MEKLSTKWKQELVLHQAISLEVASIRHENDIENREFANIS